MSPTIPSEMSMNSMSRRTSGEMARFARVSEALIVDAVRTPIGRYRGALATVRPDDLAARGGRRRRRADRARPTRDRRLLGRRQPVGRGQSRRRRMAALLAGLPVESRA